MSVRTTYTGKLYGRQDDLVIALQLSLIGCQKFFQDSKYKSFRPEHFGAMPEAGDRRP